MPISLKVNWHGQQMTAKVRRQSLVVEYVFCSRLPHSLEEGGLNPSEAASSWYRERIHDDGKQPAAEQSAIAALLKHAAGTEPRSSRKIGPDSRDSVSLLAGT